MDWFSKSFWLIVDPMRRKKILVVDDSKTALMMEQTMLGLEDFEVLTAHDGLDALDTAARAQPDLILMDVVMPRMDGFEACRQLRSSPSTEHIPIIMVTTRAEEKHVTRGYVSGCSDYVVKPINGVELLAKIHDLLPD